MTKTAQSLLSEAMELPEADRAELAERLLESLHPPPAYADEAAWLEELDRRIALVQSGKAEYGSWPEFRDRLLAQLDADA